MGSSVRKVLFGGMVLALLVGCSPSPASEPSSNAPQSGTTQSSPSTSPSPTPSGPLTTASIQSVSVTSGWQTMKPTDVVQVAVTDGKLTKVTATDGQGNPVPGNIKGNDWRPERPFKLRTQYRFEVEAAGTDGQVVKASASGQTVSPALVVEIDFLHTTEPGSGMPIWARFDLPVKDQAERQAIMATATVTTVPAQEGSWAWADENTMFWRPKEYWQPGSKAHVDIKAAGLPVGDTFVLADVSADYVFGEQRVLKADIDRHRLSAWVNGQEVANFAASYGKPGDETMTGTKLIMAKEGRVVMDSSTYGRPVDSPDGYRMEVDLAQRITWSGEYIHAAPWADASHGNANVSHGCTGLSNADATWMWNFTRAGDPVEFVGSTKKVAPGDTFGPWVYSWPEWQAAGDGRLTGWR